MALIPLTPQSFAQAHWLPLQSAAFARTVSLVELNASELPAAACHLPVGFVSNADGQIGLHAVLGVQLGKNLFVAADGSWLGGYWPQRLRLAPFALARSEAGDTLLCLNDDWWTPAPEHGHAFYAEGGQLSEQTAAVLQAGQQLLAGQAQTHALCTALDEAGLIQPWNPTIPTEQGNIQLEGLSAINEAALNALDAATLHRLHASGALALAYCQLISMQHLAKLSELANAHARLEARASIAPPAPPAPPGADLQLNFLDNDTMSFGNA